MSNPKTILRKEREKSKKFAELERKLDQIVQELERRKQLAVQGRFNYRKVGSLDSLIRDFTILVKEVNAIVRRDRENASL